MPASHQNCITSLKAVCCNKTKLIKERKMRPSETAKFDAVILENVFNFTPLSLSFLSQSDGPWRRPLSLQHRTPAPKPFDERAHSMQPTGTVILLHNDSWKCQPIFSVNSNFHSSLTSSSRQTSTIFQAQAPGICWAVLPGRPWDLGPGNWSPVGTCLGSTNNPLPDLIITVSIAFSNMPVLALQAQHEWSRFSGILYLMDTYFQKELQDWTCCFIATDFSTWAAALPTLTNHVNHHVLFLYLWSSCDPLLLDHCSPCGTWAHHTPSGTRT